MKNIINVLTYGRIALGPIIFFVLVIAENFGLALSLFILASLSDYFDGFLARKYNLTSVMGEILDPIADKILIVFLLFALSLHFDSTYIGLVGSFILAREFWVAALRDINARNNNTDATQVSFMAKVKTSLQLFAIGTYLTGIFLNNALVIFISDFILFAAFLVTIQTGIEYSQATFKD